MQRKATLVDANHLGATLESVVEENVDEGMKG